MLCNKEAYKTIMFNCFRSHTHLWDIFLSLLFNYLLHLVVSITQDFSMPITKPFICAFFTYSTFRYRSNGLLCTETWLNGRWILKNLVSFFTRKTFVKFIYYEKARKFDEITLFYITFKGQLISEWLFCVLNLPKKQPKNLKDFCPRI